MACFFPLLFVAAQRLPGGVAATLGAAQPIIVAGLAVVVLSEHPSVWRLIWGGIGVVGVALVVLGPQAGLDAPSRRLRPVRQLPRGVESRLRSQDDECDTDDADPTPYQPPH